MATRLVFSSHTADGTQLVVRVDKSPEDVFREWTRAGDDPFPLEREDGGLVYVNPRAIAFWEADGDANGKGAPSG